jgi:hypothetical protein
MSLHKLIAPYPADVFISDYFEKQYLHLRRNDPSYFADLHGDLDLEHQIWRHSAQWGDVSLARADTAPADNIYADRPPSVNTVAAAFGNGYTVVVNNYQQKSPRIASFCREVEKYFCFRCNVNLYLTAARCKGLGAHYDDQDVFVMQLDGEKTWRVYEGGPLLPLEDQPYDCPDTAALPFVEIVLRPGDVLYLPRGFIHEAHTEREQSLHITLSVSAVRQVTLIKQLLQRAAAANSDLRRSISFRNLRERTPDPGQREMSTLKNVVFGLGQADMRQVVSDFQDRFLHAVSRLPNERLRIRDNARGVTIESPLQVMEDQICVVSGTVGACTLKFIGGQIPLSEDLFDAARFVCEKKRFQVSEIAGDLSDAQKVAFAGFLIDHGVLTHA